MAPDIPSNETKLPAIDTADQVVLLKRKETLTSIEADFLRWHGLQTDLPSLKVRRERAKRQLEDRVLTGVLDQAIASKVDEIGHLLLRIAKTGPASANDVLLKLSVAQWASAYSEYASAVFKSGRDLIAQKAKEDARKLLGISL